MHELLGCVASAQGRSTCRRRVTTPPPGAATTTTATPQETRRTAAPTAPPKLSGRCGKAMAAQSLIATAQCTSRTRLNSSGLRTSEERPTCRVVVFRIFEVEVCWKGMCDARLIRGDGTSCVGLSASVNAVKSVPVKSGPDLWGYQNVFLHVILFLHWID